MLHLQTQLCVLAGQRAPPKLTPLPAILSFNSGDYRSINQRFAIIYLCFSTLSRQRDTAALCLGSQWIINIRWEVQGWESQSLQEEMWREEQPP